MAAVLAFNLTEEEKKKLRILCAGMKIMLKVIDRSYFGCRIGDLAAGKADACEDPDIDIKEPMLVLASFSGSQLNSFLQGFRRYGVPPIGLKAMLTPSNAEWTAARLYTELSAERDALKTGKPVHETETGGNG